MHGARHQQRRDRSEIGGGVAVRHHDQLGASRDRLGRPGLEVGDGGSQPVATLGHGVAGTEHRGLELGELTVIVGVDDLGQLVAGDHRVRQCDVLAGVRTRVEDVGLGAEGRRGRRDEFLADGVEWRVGHLSEQLLEVVEQLAGPVRQHGEGRVGAHRTDRLGAAQHHRFDQDLEFFLGVAVGHELRDQVVVDGVLDPTVGKFAELDDLAQPLAVGSFGREPTLDLLVADDAALDGVDEEHLAGLEPALLDDLRRFDVEHADLGGHDDQTVVGDPVAARAQAVAVEHGADDGAVGEHDRCRAVPGLHQCGVEAVEVALRLVHRRVLLPRLRDHHQHGVGQLVAAEVEEFEGLVEAGGVRGVGGADRVDAVEPIAPDLALEQRLAGPHPVAVALDGVDLTVVGHEPVRVGQRPRRERVGAEPGMDQRQSALEPHVEQVGEELRQLGRGEHALVDDRAGAEAGEVDLVADRLGDLVFDPLAQDIRVAIECEVGMADGRGDDELLEDRHHTAGLLAQA